MVKTYCPKSLAEALEIRKEAVVTPFAGGTDLMVKHQAISGALPDFPKDILFIGDLNELQGIEITEKDFRIGAGVKLSALLEEKQIPDYMIKPIQGMASPSIRNLGTIGGNICNASPAGDTLPLLYALDAMLELASTRGVRWLKISEFIKGPGKTDIEVDEILTQILIPKLGEYKYGYRKIGVRKANAISKLSVFCLAEIEQSTIKDIRIALGSLGPIVIRSREIEEEIVGLEIEKLSGEIDDIVEAYGKIMTPISDVRSTMDYRRDVALGVLSEIIGKLA